MNLQKQVASDYIEAMKNKDVVKKNLLSTIKGEIETKAKNNKVENLEDKEVLDIMSKSLKNLSSTFELLKNSTDGSIDIIKKEMDIISKYLPIEMGSNEIIFEIEQLINNGVNNIGGIMAHFKDLNADKKYVSQMAKEMLNN